MVVARDWAGGGVGMVDVDQSQKVQTFSNKMNKFWGFNAQYGDYSSNTALYT